MRIDLAVGGGLRASESLALDRHFLESAARTGAATLRVYTLAGQGISLGRYHALPPGLAEAARESGSVLFRRLTGGKVLPCGEGFIGFSLALPHRSALLFDDALSLAPFQVMNRYVRGVLKGLRAAGIEAFYPGRDLVTVRGRLLGCVSFTTQRAGALLFEGLLGATRDLSRLVPLIDSLDPQGALPSPFFAPEHVTSLSAETRGQGVSLSSVTELLREGFSSQFSLPVVRRELSSEERGRVEEIEAEAFSGGSWLGCRPLRADLPYEGVSSIELGVLCARFSLGPGGRLGELSLCGDFIANAEAVDALEKRLCGCPPSSASIAEVVDGVFARPENFLLGVGPLETISQTILKGLPEHR